MKKMQPLQVAMILVCSLALAACANNDKEPKGDIPYDESSVRDNIISIQVAREYTASFRRATAELRKTLNDTGYLSRNFNLPVAVQFNRDVLALLLNQLDSAGNRAAGVRMYFARNQKNEITLVLVPYRRNNDDIIKRLLEKDVAGIPGIPAAFAQQLDAQAVDNALRCPTFCDRSGGGLGDDLGDDFGDGIE